MSPGRERPAARAVARPVALVAVFVIALVARLAFLIGVDEPLLYTHQYHYFNGGLTIAEHPHAWSYVLRSDEWHTWSGSWTMAPLYHLFLGMVFRLLGPHLFPVQVIQCVLGALTAVLVSVIGDGILSRRGWGAGLVLALYWPSIELASRTLTENIHTLLLVAAFAVLLRAVKSSRAHVPLFGAGLLLGLSALARAVSAGFLLPVAVWILCRFGWRRGFRSALFWLLGGVVAIGPWAARNALVMGDPVLIETVGTWNLWTDNAFVGNERYDMQAHFIRKQATPAEGRSLALLYAWWGIRDSPRRFGAKVVENFDHFFRPEGLHQLLGAELPQPTWRHAASILADDLPLAFSVFGFAVFLVAARPSAERSLFGWWTAYYVFMVVVVFHNEIRYRSAFVPFAMLGAVGALPAWRAQPNRRIRRTGLIVGVALLTMMFGGWAGPVIHALEGAWTLAPARSMIERGALADARSQALLAATRDPGVASPWLRYGRWLVRTGHAAEAVDVYERVRAERADNWVPRLVLPRLLRESGRSPDAEAALVAADAFSWNVDPWLALEIAWRELPPPHGDAIQLGHDDYGAVRGFFHPRGDHRWSRHQAELRLIPTAPAADYEATVWMGSPDPSPLRTPSVELCEDWTCRRIELSTEVRPYSIQVRPVGGVVRIHLRAPTWCRVGETAEQGVRVDRMTVASSR